MEMSRHHRTTVFFVVISFLFLATTPLFARQWAGSGITEPFREATVSSSVSGSVVAINAVEGSSVEENEIIIELDSTLERLDVDRRRLIADSTVDLDASLQQVEMKKKDYESTKQLFDETQSISEQEVLSKELDVMVAQAEYDRLLLAEQLEEFEYRIAQAQLEKRTIVAPFGGVVVEVITEVGENCSPGQPLIRIVDIRQVRLVVFVEPNISRRLKVDMEVTVSIEGGGSAIVRKGVVEFISPVVDASSGLREVKVVFDNKDDAVPPGTTGSLYLE